MGRTGRTYIQTDYWQATMTVMTFAAHFQEHNFKACIEVKLRAARDTDLAALEWWGWYSEHREIIHSAYEQSQRGEGLMIVAESAGSPVGQAWLDLKKKARRKIGILWAVRVIPGFRNAGIGTHLIAAAEYFLMSAGFQTCEIGVELDNPSARRLYERMGYRPAGAKRDEKTYFDPAGNQKMMVSELSILRKRLERPLEEQDVAST